MMLKDYSEEIDFSVKMNKLHTPIPWKKILKKVKREKKSYDERDYAYGIYQILPSPKEKEEELILSPVSELIC
ncbi:MAG: hypothetical protein KGY65_03620 [Candidatus Thermoplasmatota archaeon]|nr:hypothetical protein [Candidatus Thermoplasmatota archaeon]